MARTLCYFPLYRGEDYQTRQALTRQIVEDFRDKVRNSLNALDWGVSDIAVWLGLSNQHEGYAFLVQHRVAGVPSGKTWVLGFSGRPVATGQNSRLVWANNNATTYPQYFRDTNSISAGVGSDLVGMTQVLHYNDKGNFVLDVQASSTSGVPTLGETLTGSINGSTATLETIVTPDANWLVEMKTGRSFVSGEILTGGTSGATFTIGGINDRPFYDFSFSDWDLLSYSGGDFTTLVHSPFSNIAAFMPTSQRLWGASLTFSNLNQNLKAPSWYIFDDDKPFISIYRNKGSQMDAFDFVIGGEIIDTYKGVGVDDLKAGLLMGRMVQSSPGITFSTIQESFCFGYYGDYLGGGDRTIFTLYNNDYFRVTNTPREDGTFQYTRVLLADANEHKGSLDPEIFRNQGAKTYHWNLGLTLNATVGIKLSDIHVFPWVVNELPPTVIRWDEELDKDLL